MHACMHACMHVCMYVCMYVCIYSSARRPNHTSYDKKTAVVSSFRSSGYATKREQLTEVWEVSERNLGREKTLKNIARVCSERSFSHAAFHVRKASTEQKPAKNDVFSPFLSTGGVRERSERAPGGGPGRVRERSEKCFERLRCRLISVVCPNRARELKKCVNRPRSEPISGQNWQIIVSF